MQVRERKIMQYINTDLSKFDHAKRHWRHIAWLYATYIENYFRACVSAYRVLHV